MADSSTAKASDGRNDFAKLQRDINELKDTIHALTNDFADIASHTKERVGERASEKTAEIGERVAAVGANVRERGEQASQSAQTYVREHPVQSVLIAFGVGLLVARLTARQ